MSPFLWGVATSAYQAEGGYNAPGEPLTNWRIAEKRGDVAPVGRAGDFWNRFEDDFERCREMGLNAFRMGIEWSRVQPIRGGANGSDAQPERAFSAQAEAPPPFDFEALAHYVRIFSAARARALEPVVTLHHFVHPAWLGPDPWLESSTAALFAAYVRTAVLYVNERLEEPLQWFITINEPNMLVLNTYLGHQFPAQALGGFRTMTRAYNELLRAHLLAYNSLHDLYEEKGWPAPRVTINNYCSDLYWSDKVLLDLLCARERQVARHRVGDHVCDQGRAFELAFRRARIPLRKDLAYYFGAVVKRISNWIGYRSFQVDDFAPFLEALYHAPRARCLDYIGLDYYDPFAAHAFRFPVFWDHEFKNRSFRSWVLSTITSKWWDWRVLPRGLHFFCRYYAHDFGRPVLIAENGMAIRRRTSATPTTRRDRMTRSQFLRLHVHEVVKIVNDQVPLAGYLHWSLFDNYEWGTYSPRFGLFSIDFARGLERLVEDPWGDRPSETYAALIAEAHAKMKPAAAGREFVQ